VKYNYCTDYSGLTFYSKYIKRLIDALLALLLFIVTFPFVLIAALAIRMDSKGPALFTQQRVGQYGQIIKIFKLRTMILETHDAKGQKLRDRERITRAGRIIRKLSLDELPQLINVLKGDMSFIGPRPLLIRYFPYYTDEEVQRHNVLPGITGLAQVRGRSFLGWEKRFQYDLEYVENISLTKDLRVVFETIQAVFTGAGTSAVRPKGLVDFDEHRKFEKRRESLQ